MHVRRVTTLAQKNLEKAQHRWHCATRRSLTIFSHKQVGHWIVRKVRHACLQGPRRGVWQRDVLCAGFSRESGTSVWRVRSEASGNSAARAASNPFATSFTFDVARCRSAGGLATAWLSAASGRLRHVCEQSSGQGPGLADHRICTSSPAQGPINFLFRGDDPVLRHRQPQLGSGLTLTLSNPW